MSQNKKFELLNIQQSLLAIEWLFSNKHSY